eukprot:477387-Hanusia_phi.AAC.4
MQGGYLAQHGEGWQGILQPAARTRRYHAGPPCDLGLPGGELEGVVRAGHDACGAVGGVGVVQAGRVRLQAVREHELRREEEVERLHDVRKQAGGDQREAEGGHPEGVEDDHGGVADPEGRGHVRDAKGGAYHGKPRPDDTDDEARDEQGVVVARAQHHRLPVTPEQAPDVPRHRPEQVVEELSVEGRALEPHHDAVDGEVDEVLVSGGLQRGHGPTVRQVAQRPAARDDPARLGGQRRPLRVVQRGVGEGIDREPKGAGQDRALQRRAAEVEVHRPGKGAVRPGAGGGSTDRLRHARVERHRAREALHLLHLRPPAALQQVAPERGTVEVFLHAAVVVQQGGGDRAVSQQALDGPHRVTVGGSELQHFVAAAVAERLVAAGPPRVQQVEQDQRELADVVAVDEDTPVDVDLVPQRAVGLRRPQHHQVEVQVRQRLLPHEVVARESHEERAPCNQRQQEAGGKVPGHIPRGRKSRRAGGEDTRGSIVLLVRVPGVHAHVIVAEEVGSVLLGKQPPAVRAATARGGDSPNPQGHQHGRVAEGGAVDAVAVHVGRVGVVTGGCKEVAIADGVGGGRSCRVAPHVARGLREAQPGQLVRHLLPNLGHRAGLRGDLGEEAGADAIGPARLDDAHGLARALRTGHVAKRGLDLRVHEGTGGVGLVDALLVRHAWALLRLWHVAQALLPDGVAAEAIDRVDVRAVRARVAHHGVGVARRARAKAGVGCGTGQLRPRRAEAVDVARPAARRCWEGAPAGVRLVVVADVAVHDLARGAVQIAELVAHLQEDLVGDPLERADAQEARVGDALEQVANEEEVLTKDADDRADDREEEVLHEPVEQLAHQLDDGHELASKGGGAEDAEDHVSDLIEQLLGLVDEHVEPLEHGRHHDRRALQQEEAQEVDYYHHCVEGELDQPLHDGAQVGYQVLNGHQPHGRALLLQVVVLPDDGGELGVDLWACVAVHRLVEVPHGLRHELLVGYAVGCRVVEVLRLHAHAGRLAARLLYPLDEVSHPHAKVVHLRVERADADGDHRHARRRVLQYRRAARPHALRWVHPVRLAHRPEATPGVLPRRHVALALRAVGPVAVPEGSVVRGLGWARLGRRRHASLLEQPRDIADVRRHEAVDRPAARVRNGVERRAARPIPAHLLPDVACHHPCQGQPHRHPEADEVPVDVARHLFAVVHAVNELAGQRGLGTLPAAPPVIGGVGHLLTVQSGDGHIKRVVRHGRRGRVRDPLEVGNGALEMGEVEPATLTTERHRGWHPDQLAHVALPARVQRRAATVPGDVDGHVPQLEATEAVMVGTGRGRCRAQRAPVAQGATCLGPIQALCAAPGASVALLLLPLVACQEVDRLQHRAAALRLSTREGTVRGGGAAADFAHKGRRSEVWQRLPVHLHRVRHAVAHHPAHVACLEEHDTGTRSVRGDRAEGRIEPAPEVHLPHGAVPGGFHVHAGAAQVDLVQVVVRA